MMRNLVPMSTEISCVNTKSSSGPVIESGESIYHSFEVIITKKPHCKLTVGLTCILNCDPDK